MFEVDEKTLNLATLAPLTLYALDNLCQPISTNLLESWAINFILRMMNIIRLVKKNMGFIYKV